MSAIRDQKEISNPSILNLLSTTSKYYIVSVVLLVIVAYVVITSYYTSIQKTLILQIVNNSMGHVEDFIDLSGGIRKTDDKLFLGANLIDGTSTLVDHLQRKTGFGCTFFSGNVRVSTTATLEGSSRRAIGTTANKEITRLVFEQGKEFVGITKTLDRNWLIFYKPLVDNNGRRVGMIALFREESDFQTSNLMFKLLIAISLLILGFIVIYFIYRGNLSYRALERNQKVVSDSVSQIAAFSREIGRGNLSAEAPFTQEQEKLSSSLVEMRDNLKETLSEIAKVTERVGREGNISLRLDLSKNEGAWKEISENINKLVSIFSQPLMELQNITEALSAGDLTIRYETEADGDIQLVANNLNHALDTLGKLLKEISGTADSVRNSALEMLSANSEMSESTGKVTQAINEISSGAQNQADKINESSGIVEEIMISSRDMERQAETIFNSAQNGVLNSEEGGHIVRKVSNNITDINELADQTQDSIEQLTKSTTDINQFLAIITEIAAQTNLLSLNAAIEAAQAGDAGRGFAVVAEEIRKLAQNAGESVRSIESIVATVEENAKIAMNSTNSLTEKVTLSSADTQLISEAFEKILTSSHQTLGESENILKATKKQIQDVSGIVKSTESVLFIAEDTASGAVRTAASLTELSATMKNLISKAEELNDTATSLFQSLENFKL